jgi:hypothetical protein
VRERPPDAAAQNAAECRGDARLHDGVSLEPGAKAPTQRDGAADGEGAGEKHPPRSDFERPRHEANPSAPEERDERGTGEPRAERRREAAAALERHAGDCRARKGEHREEWPQRNA